MSTARVSGHTGVGTQYRAVSRFRGRAIELGDIVTELVPDCRIVLCCENRTVLAEGTIRVSPSREGSEVTYRTEPTFRGLARLAARCRYRPCAGSGMTRRRGRGKPWPA